MNRPIRTIVHLNTLAYEAAHGHKPPMHRYALWVFRVGGEEEWISGSYKQARTEALALARQRGVTEVVLGS